MPGSIAWDRAARARALKEVDAVFTGQVGKVNPLAQTNSIPAVLQDLRVDATGVLQRVGHDTEVVELRFAIPKNSLLVNCLGELASLVLASLLR